MSLVSREARRVLKRRGVVCDPVDLLVADQIDGRAIERRSLFRLVGTMQDGKPIVIGSVTSIVLQRSDSLRP